MKYPKIRLEHWLILFVGVIILLMLNTNKPKKIEIPKEPPKLIEFKKDNCEYFWFQNWDGNFTLFHKNSCTNAPHSQQVFIQLNQVQPPQRQQGLRTIF